jgi:hypothetical protein
VAVPTLAGRGTGRAVPLWVYFLLARHGYQAFWTIRFFSSVPLSYDLALPLSPSFLSPSTTGAGERSSWVKPSSLAQSTGWSSEVAAGCPCVEECESALGMVALTRGYSMCRLRAVLRSACTPAVTRQLARKVSAGRLLPARKLRLGSRPREDGLTHPADTQEPILLLPWLWIEVACFPHPRGWSGFD